MSYHRRASALHAAGAGAGIAYCLALACAALLLDNPILLLAVLLALAGAFLASSLRAELSRCLVLALPLAVMIAVINALVTRDGLTVIVRLGDLPVLGHTDITLEALTYGGVLALRAAALILCGGLYTAAVDPDAVLRLFRRLSLRSALTATLATRMVPVLLRDSRRLADAQRCRPGPPPSRFALLRAASAGAFDRALDVAAALEVRGYGSARRPPRARRGWGRHDLEFGAAAVLILLAAAMLRVSAAADFQAYPSLALHAGAAAWGGAAALLIVALAPFADRLGVAR